MLKTAKTFEGGLENDRLHMARGDHVLSPLISISEAPIDSYGLMDMEQCGALLRYCDKEKLKT